MSTRLRQPAVGSAQALRVDHRLAAVVLAVAIAALLAVGGGVLPSTETSRAEVPLSTVTIMAPGPMPLPPPPAPPHAAG